MGDRDAGGTGRPPAVFRAVGGGPLGPSGSDRVFTGLVVAIGVFLIVEAAGFFAISRFNTVRRRASTCGPSWPARPSTPWRERCWCRAPWPPSSSPTGPGFLLLGWAGLHCCCSGGCSTSRCGTRPATMAKTGVLNCGGVAGDSGLRPRSHSGARSSSWRCVVIDIDHFKAVNDAVRPPGRRRGAWPWTADTIVGCVRSQRRRRPLRRRRVLRPAVLRRADRRRGHGRADPPGGSRGSTFAESTPGGDRLGRVGDGAGHRRPGGADGRRRPGPVPGQGAPAATGS